MLVTADHSNADEMLEKNKKAWLEFNSSHAFC